MIFAFIFFAESAIAGDFINVGPTSPRAPEWINDLIIYQMRVDQFTPEGTINAAKNKLSYLQDLGITAVLLNPIAEFNKGSYGSRTYRDVRHIYYGVKESNKLEFLLGTDQDFKNFVDEAHRRGIKVFVDTVTSGVISEQLAPLAGDWDGDAINTSGLYNFRDAVFDLRNHNSAGSIDMSFNFGSFAKQLPLAGDWDGDGKDSVGLYDPQRGMFYLKNSLSGGPADTSFQYGATDAGWLPLAGDWNGNGEDTIGLYDPALSMFYLKNSLASGDADISIQYGAANAGWLPLAGDWDGDGKDSVGLYDPWNSEFYLKTDGNLKFIFLARSLSTFTKNHPDWFKKDANGNIAKNVFGLDIWDFNNNQFRNWWINMMVNDWILKFDLDGLRLDLEPNVSNFSEIWSRVRQLAQQNGKDVVLFSESRDGNGISGDNRHQEYDFTEWGFGVDPVWGGIDFLNNNYNIVDTIKGEKFSDRYYTSTLSYSNTGSVDSQGRKGPHYNANGNLAYFAYGMILSPFIPVWYMGEEFNNQCLMPNGLNGLKSCQNYISADVFDRLYFIGMQWSGAVNNGDFLKKVKKIIQIRKENIDIISPRTLSLAQTQIVKVGHSGTDLVPYALYNDASAIVVVAKKNAASGDVVLRVPLTDMNLSGANTYSVTNLMSGDCDQVSQNDLAAYAVSVNAGDAAVLEINKNTNCEAGCTSKTCASLGNYQCGSWSDGCGAMIDCGTCGAGKTCNVSGQCVSQTAGGPVISDSDPQTLTETPQKMTRAEILQKIAEVKQLLIQLIIQLIAELQKQLAAIGKN